MAMFPHERSLVERLASKPFALLGVNGDDDREKLKEVIKSEKITWRSFWNGRSGPIPTQYSVEGWPTLYLVDAKGVIREKWLGSPPDSVLDRAIDALIKETEAQGAKSE